MAVDPLGVARAKYAIWDRSDRKRVLNASRDRRIRVPAWLPDEVVYLADIASLDLEAPDRTVVRYSWGDDEGPALVYDWRTGLLMAVGWKPERGTLDPARATVQNLPAVAGHPYVVPRYLPQKLPVVGRLAQVVYVSDKFGDKFGEKFGESDAVNYRHDFGTGAKWDAGTRPFVAVSREGDGVLVFVGHGLYDVTARGIVTPQERRLDDESLTDMPWPAEAVAA